MKKDIESTIEHIKKVYTLAFNSVYVLDNVNDENQAILTYNIDMTNPVRGEAPESTISVHRKKQTNTIYTINAINKLIEEKNGGVLDKTYKIEWPELQNTVLVTAYGRLKKVNTKIANIVTIQN
jgi:Asp-tRNA(Asn)/Glu-tRNA(Gln) amidotransferase C subunit